MQERDGENGICEGNIGNKILDDAGETWDKGDEREVNSFFAVG
jgi:hypothetical protein